MNKRKIFILEHCVEMDEDNDDYKLIGIYTTRKKAEAALKEVRQLPGFKDYPDDCFHLEADELRMLSFTEGFIREACYEGEKE